MNGFEDNEKVRRFLDSFDDGAPPRAGSGVVAAAEAQLRAARRG